MPSKLVFCLSVYLHDELAPLTEPLQLPCDRTIIGTLTKDVNMFNDMLDRATRSHYHITIGGPVKPLYMVLLKNNGCVVTLDTPNPTCFELVKSYKNDANQFIGWKSFTDLDRSNLFVKQLRSIDRDALGNLVSLTPRQTDFNDAEANANELKIAAMMAAEATATTAGLHETADSELGLYTTNRFGFGSALAMISYVEWGSTGHTRAALAVASGFNSSQRL